MEKTLCDDCSRPKEATKKVGNRYFCSHCAVRVLQQDSSGDGWHMGSQWKGHGSMPQSKL